MSVNPDFFERQLPMEVSGNSFHILHNGQWGVMQALSNYLANATDLSNIRGFVTAPTGSGKTVMFSRLLEDMRSQSMLLPTVIVEPTNQLVEQTVEEMKDRGFKGNIERLNTFRPDNGDNSVRVTTYAAFAIKANQAQQFSLEPRNIGMLIFDEAHHLQGESTQRALEKFGHAAMLGFTASPDYSEKLKLSNILPDEIYTIPHAEAVESGLIAPYTTILLETGSDLRDVPIVGGDYDVRSLERAINLTTRNEIITNFYLDNFRGERAIFNTGTIAHAAEIARILKDKGVRAAAVSGEMPSKELKATLKEFSNGSIEVITQARLLGEGYNEPRVGLVFNVNPTLSKVRAKQRTGRAGRTDKDNPHKVMLVVECLDHSYRRKPLFYGHPDVAGSWQAMRDDQKKDVEARTEKIPEAQGLANVIFNFEKIGRISDVGVRRAKKYKWVPTDFDMRGMPCEDVDPALFFPERGGSLSQGRNLCSGCTKAEPCLMYALSNGLDFGLWGGASHKERRTLRRVFNGEGHEAGMLAVRNHIINLRSS